MLVAELLTARNFLILATWHCAIALQISHFGVLYALREKGAPGLEYKIVFFHHWATMEASYTLFVSGTFSNVLVSYLRLL